MQAPRYRIAMKLALLAIAATVAACGTHEAQKQPLPPDRAAELLHERVWLDHAPKRPTERFHLVLFDEGGSGVRQHRTVWKGDFELFFHEIDGGELEFVLPATGTTMRSAFRVVPARGPDGADYKLVIDHPPTGPREFYGWPLEGGSADAWLATRFARRGE